MLLIPISQTPARTHPCQIRLTTAAREIRTLENHGMSQKEGSGGAYYWIWIRWFLEKFKESEGSVLGCVLSKSRGNLAVRYLNFYPGS